VPISNPLLSCHFPPPGGYYYSTRYTTMEQLSIMQRVSIAQEQIENVNMKADITISLLNDTIRSALSVVYGGSFYAKDAQVASIRKLIYDSSDLILAAPADFPKGPIIQAVSILRRNTTSIILIPSNNMAKEQSRKIDQIGGRSLLL
jgi:hypothetical protein